MLGDNFSCLGWAFGSYFQFDRLAAEFRSVQTLFWIAAVGAAMFLYWKWRDARSQTRKLRSNTLERIGCNRLIDSRVPQEGPEINDPTVGKQGSPTLNAPIGRLT